MTAPVFRPLRGYALDPGFSTRLDTAGINEVVYHIPFEDLEPGPVGEYVEVVDVDPASGCWYEPVDLGHEHIASQQGLAPSEGNPQFHQQFVYAVAMKTIRHFERALGRKIVWYPRIVRPRGDEQHVDVPWPREYVARLRIHPHALRDANAYYDPSRAALLFGYFTAARQHQGTNYPGGLVFTCLSPDIVAHETTHAILDAIHHRYMEDTNPDVAAFHEGFADIVALLQRFTFRELVEHQLLASGGRVDGQTAFGALATQFGEALAGHRGALRNMIGRWVDADTWAPLDPNPSDYAEAVEPHDRGAVLVATVFDAFRRVYAYQTADLIRIATNGTGVLPEGQISTDLVRRLAAEASEIAEHLLHICIRALDYCPPVDISFGSYMRALITADLDIAPEDAGRYRVALIEAFRARGIFPKNVNTLSVESLRWNRPELTRTQAHALNWLANHLRNDIRMLVETTDREQLYERSRAAAARLHALFDGKGERLGDREWESLLNALGMTARSVSRLFGRRSPRVKFLLNGQPNDAYVPAVEVHTIRPAFRSGREGRQIEQVVIVLTQRVSADVGQGGRPVPMIFRGGCSLILSLGDFNKAEYAVVKDIRSYDRFAEQASYVRGDDARHELGIASVYDDDSRRPWALDFELLHSR